jgi:surface polysaccharide O-acyltransferase-like enzyme
MKIGISYIFWSLVYCIKEKLIKNINLKDFILKFIVGHYHLWFLNSINILYMIVPFLFLVVKNKNILNYFFILSFISTFILRNIYLYSKYFIKKDTINIIDKIYNKLDIKYVSGDIFYFIFGYYLNTKEMNNEYKIIIYILGFIGILFTTKISYYFSFIKKKKINHFSSKYFNIFFTSISIFIFFKSYFNNLKINDIKNNIIQYLSQMTFGIYLIHPLIIVYMKKLNIFFFKINTIFLIPIITLVIFIISLIFSIILKKIPKFGKYLI